MYFNLFQKFKYIIAFIGCYFCWACSAKAYNNGDTTAFSSKAQAIKYIEKISSLTKSIYWPNVKPDLFLSNLKSNIYNPLSIYEGSNTNFCGYAALSYLPLHNDPLGYAKFMIELFETGKATIRNEKFLPSAAIQKTAGTLSFKGTLDIRPADQVWFLCLADHFKGYINYFNNSFQPGDEDKTWAAVNYAKFNRMIKKLYNYKVNAIGADLIRPHVNDFYDYISKRLVTGTVFLFLDNRYLTKKTHSHFRPTIPTHFITVLDIVKTGDLITIIYWDYGGKTLRQLTPAFLKKIIFGISHCTKKKSDGN
jgi:hypothetical protein